jgi:uncharacterized protein (TIGR03437 family)
MLSLPAWFLIAGCAAAQTLSAPVQCSQDRQGNQVCVGSETDTNICGYVYGIFGSGTTIYCRDVVVQKKAADGRIAYTHVLGGSSDQLPYGFLFDPQGDVALFGTTYSSDFPTTPNAVQTKYGGSPSVYETYGNPPPGGDIFLSILGPAGDLLYSTFLGSSGSNTVLGISSASLVGRGRAPSEEIVEALVSAGAGDFPGVADGSATQPGGLVFLTFDLARRTLTHSEYLPVPPRGFTVPFVASMTPEGAVQVTTASALYTFHHDLRSPEIVSLASFAFSEVPQTYPDSTGDVWLVGENTSQQWIVSELAGGVTEVFRWVAPPSAISYLKPVYFGPNGLAYVGGAASAPLSTTPNAPLEVPCFANPGGPMLAVFNSQGQVQMLSYLPSEVLSFSADSDGSVSAITDGDVPILINLTQHPDVACALDAISGGAPQTSLTPQPSAAPKAFGIGQLVQVRGGGFGPSAPVTVAPGANQIYPTWLGSLSVEVGGIPAPILAAAPGEATIQIPFETPSGDAVPVIVQYGGQQSAALQIPVAAIVPWLEPGGDTNNYNPVPYGSTLTVYLAGAGPYAPPLADGQVPPNDQSHGLQLPISVSFNPNSPYVSLPGTIVYAGPAPGQIGLAEIQFQLPLTGPQPTGNEFFLLNATITIGPATLSLLNIAVK